MKSWKINLLSVLGASVVAFALAEGALRLVGYSNPSFYHADLDLGVALRPGAEGWWTKEGRAYVHINSKGLRDREHTSEKPANTLRIAVLGDSYAEALQVPMEEAFWAVMERSLQHCPGLQGKKAEAINFGVSGYGTAQELLTLRHRVWRYDPDIVVLAVVTGNDIRDNSRVLEGDPMRPYFVLDNDSLVLDDSYQADRGFRWRRSWVARVVYATINHIRFLQLINAARQALRQWNQQEHSKQMEKSLAPEQEIGLDNMVYLAPKTAVWRDAWEVTEELLVAMSREVNERDKRFLLVTLSNGIQVYPSSKTREAFAIRLGVKDLFYPDRRIQALAQRERIPFLALAMPMQEWAEKHGTCVHGFPNASPCGGHWNERGHRLAGELIADKICRDLL
jgi:hypothetical protein